jgi:nucleoside-diphosphate-sugar epimerase
MKLLLVGGTGVLSTAITQEALKKNIEIFMINRGNKIELIPQGTHLLKADIKNKRMVLSLLHDMHFDAVIDCICFTEKDIEYSFNLFKDKVNQYIFISSCAVYNKAICKLCEEDSPKVLPVWKYSVNKNKCEEFLIKLATTNQINYTIIRPAVTYGNTRIPYGITPPYGYHWTIVERILHGKPLITWNNGENRYNITHVDDFAIGVVGLLGNQQAYNEAFNIVGNETPSWKEVLDVLSNLLNIKVKTVDIPSEYYAKEIPSRKGEILGGRSISTVCSNRKIKSAVEGFKQNILLKEGLKRTVEYYKTHNYIYGIDYAFDADTDRIIAKYAKENNISTKDMNLHFIDYFHNNNPNDKWSYFISRNKDYIAIKGFIFIKRIINKVIKVLKRYFFNANSQ